MFKVIYYQTSSGRKLVEEYLLSLPKEEASVLISHVALLETQGFEKSLLTFRQMEGRLWEIKFRKRRIFYVVITGSSIILLHAYNKQSQKTPTKELEVARRRLKETIEQFEP